jgi:hypothetical protein
MPYDSPEWQAGWLAGFAHERDGRTGPRPAGKSCEWVRGYLAGREHYRQSWLRYDGRDQDVT